MMAEAVHNKKAGKADAVKADALELVKSLNRGDVAFEMSQKLAEVVRSVMELGKPGALKLSLKISPNREMGKSAAVITADVDAVLPKADKKTDVRFATEDGRLIKDDPDQLKLPMAGMEE